MPFCPTDVCESCYCDHCTVLSCAPDASKCHARAGLAERDAHIAALEAEVKRLTDVGEEVAASLVAHRRDMHQSSKRPCPTCRRSAKALADWNEALAAASSESLTSATPEEPAP